MSDSKPVRSTCPQCGHDEIETVGTQIEGRGHLSTLSIRECLECQTLWGEPRTWFGVYQG